MRNSLSLNRESRHLERAGLQEIGNRQMSITVVALSWLDLRSPTAAVIIGGALILSIGFLSAYTGPLLSCSLLYLIPMLLVTRVAGLQAGIYAAIFATAIWLTAELTAEIGYQHQFTPYWNALMRLGTFLVAVCLVSATKSMNSHLEERVLERTSALEAQINETRELERAILEISDRERATIGQDLHDGLCQQLVGAAFTTNLLREKLEEFPSFAALDIGQIADLIDDSITQARNLARGLYPVRLETDGLEMAVRELASTTSRRFDMNCSVECPSPLPTCESSVAIHIYRIIQEAVINAVKHAEATFVTIELFVRSDRFTVLIQDNGIGISSFLSNPEGMGLSIMKYRARMIDADFGIRNCKSGGTEVHCSINCSHSS